MSSWCLHILFGNYFFFLTYEYFILLFLPPVYFACNCMFIFCVFACTNKEIEMENSKWTFHFLVTCLGPVVIPVLCVVTRFVEPIDQGSYRQWSSASHRVTQTDCERLDQPSPSRSDSGVSNNLTSQTSAETQAMPLSFVEVMRLVQEGKEVPGVTKVDVEPTNQSPTPSRMERMLKPWEISVSKWLFTFMQLSTKKPIFLIKWISNEMMMLLIWRLDWV